MVIRKPVQRIQKRLKLEMREQIPGDIEGLYCEHFAFNIDLTARRNRQPVHLG